MIRQLNRIFRSTFKHQLDNIKSQTNRYGVDINRLQQLSATSLYRFSQTKDTKVNFDSMWSQAFNKIKDVDSKEIFDQFKEEIQSLSSYEMVLNYCLFILDVMKQRFEVEKAMEVCNIAIEFSEKKHNNQKEPLLVMFKGQKTLFFNKLGKKIEAEESAKAAKETYDLIKDNLNQEDTIGAVKLLQEIYQTIENYKLAEIYAKEYLELIKKDQNRQNEPLSLFQAYSALFDCNYGQGKIKDALEFGLIASQQINKIQQKSITMHYLLVGVSFSYYQLGDTVESDRYLDLSLDLAKQLPQSKEFSDIEKKKQDYLSVRDRIQTQYQQQQSQQTSQKQQEYNSDNIWNEETDHGLDLRGMKDYKEALEFYEDKLKQLTHQSDIQKCISIQDRMALVYYEMQNISKAIEMSKKAHQQLMKLRNFQLVGDKLSFQNLSNLKIFYYQIKDYQQSIEWGQKWYSVCEQIKAFDTYSFVVEEYMIQQVLAFKELGKFKEAIDFCQKLESYVMKFNKDDPSYIFSIKKLQYELHYFDKNLPKSVDFAVEAYENIIKLKGEQADQIKQEAYNLLRNITALGLQTKDEKKILKYGTEFLKQQPSFEAPNEYTRERQLVEMNIGRISSINGDFETAETYLQKSLVTSQKLNMEQLQLSALISLASVLVRQAKIDRAFTTAQQAQSISNKLFPNQQDNEVNLSIARILSFIYHMQKDYKKCLEQVDRCLHIQKNIPGLSNEQLQPTIELLKQLKLEIEDKESVIVVANKHNLFQNE